MFHENLRKRFIQETYGDSSLAKAATSIFNALEKYEGLWGRDICTQGVREVTEALDGIVGMRSQGHRLYTNVLRDYLRWCVANGVPGATLDALDAQPSGLLKMKTRTVRSPLHMQRFLDTVFAPDEMRTHDCVYRCMLWMAYGGLPDRFVTEVQTQDVDFSHMLVCHAGYEVPIYREASVAFHACAEFSDFRLTRGDVERFRPRYESRQLLRGFQSDATIEQLRTESIRKITAAIKAGRTDIKLSYSRAYLSGLFYRAYEKEMAGIQPDFAAEALEMLDPENRGAQDKVTRTIRYLRKDYELWKSTF